MSELPFLWIDAFTDQMLGGNPCAVVLEADSLSTKKMQAIAKEMNLSETAFVMKSDKADFAARYFTPQEELPFAGHPTLATAHALVDSGLIKLTNKTTTISLNVPAGIIPIQITMNSSAIRITMSQLAPKFQRIYHADEVLPIFGLSAEDLIPGLPIQTVSTGTPILMIPLNNQQCLKKLKYVDESLYFELLKTGDFSFPHHFCMKGISSDSQTFARSLGVPPYGLEDSFTGSATGCMAAYLWKYGLLAQPHFTADQGHWMGRPGKASAEIIGSPNNIETIRLTGEAITVIRGKISITKD